MRKYSREEKKIRAYTFYTKYGAMTVDQLGQQWERFEETIAEQKRRLDAIESVLRGRP